MNVTVPFPVGGTGVTFVGCKYQATSATCDSNGYSARAFTARPTNGKSRVRVVKKSPSPIPFPFVRKRRSRVAG